MTKVVYIEFNGTKHEVDLPQGSSLMKGAVNNGVRGIIGECGGACSCATCHLYVDPQWIDKLGDKSAAEASLLEEVCDAQPNSRLGCQILVSDALEGLVVRLPAKQV